MQEIILGVMANILRTYAIYRFMEVMNPLKTVSFEDIDVFWFCSPHKWGILSVS